MYVTPPTINGVVADAKAEQGYAYKYIFPEPEGMLKYFYKAGGIDGEVRLKLWINEVLLKQSSQAHASIRDIGDGRYSLWYGSLLFSTPNNIGYDKLQSINYELQLEPTKVLSIMLVLLSIFIIPSLILLLMSFKATKIICINILIFISIFIIIFIGGEAYLRLRHHIDNYSWKTEFRPHIGYIFAPYATAYTTNHVDFFRPLVANKYGFLDRDLTPTPEAEKIVFIGDSFVEAHQVPLEQKFHILLEGMLNKNNTNKNFQTFAFGYSGTGQVNQLAYYDHIAKALKPKVVVLVIVNNDFANNSAILESLLYGLHPNYLPNLTAIKKENSFIFQEPYERFANHSILNLKANTPFALQDEIQTLFKYSAFYRYISTILVRHYPNLQFLTGHISQNENYVQKTAQILFDQGFTLLKDENNLNSTKLYTTFNEENLSPVFTEAIEATDFALQEWKKRAETDGFEIIAFFTHSLSDYCKEKSLSRNRFADLLNKNNIAYVDQCDTIKKSGMPASDAHFTYDGHWNEQGHIWAAETLLPLIKKLKNQ